MHEWPRAFTIWMEFSVIPGRIEMEWFIPVESFRKKGNTFRGISFFPLLPEFPKISVPFVHSYSARLFTVILLRKNAKDLKDGGRFPKRLSLLCVSLLVGSVGGRFRTQLQPCRWKRITFCGRYLCFSFTFQRASAWAASWEKNVDADCWFPWRKVDAAAAWKKKLSPSPKRKKQYPSRPIKRLAREEVQTPCFLLTMIYVPRPRPTGIRKFRSNDTVQSISFP